MSEVVSLFA